MTSVVHAGAAASRSAGFGRPVSRPATALFSAACPRYGRLKWTESTKSPRESKSTLFAGATPTHSEP